jgi:hypothetical protein
MLLVRIQRGGLERCEGVPHEMVEQTRGRAVRSRL